jgi:hypothetical protein
MKATRRTSMVRARPTQQGASWRRRFSDGCTWLAGRFRRDTFTHNGRLFFGVTGGYQTMPDAAVVATAMVAGIEDLLGRGHMNLAITALAEDCTTVVRYPSAGRAGEAGSSTGPGHCHADVKQPMAEASCTEAGPGAAPR